MQGTAIVGLGEVAGGTQDNRIYDLGLHYTHGPFDGLLLYVSDKTASAASPGNVSTTGFGVSYRLGAYKLYGGGIDVDDKRPANEDGRGYWIGADFVIGPHLFRGEWLSSNPRFGSDNKTTALGVGYQYRFTKRTSLYASITRFDNGRNAGPGGLGRASTPIPAGLTRLGDNNLSEVAAAMQHAF